MILEHYQDEPFQGPAESREQDESTIWRGKPRGFWVSVQGRDDWPSWCEVEQWGLGGLRFRHIVTLCDNANILHVRGARAIDALGKKYGHLDAKYGVALGEWDRRIDWRKVAAEYDGIIIAPFSWSRHLDVGWYYGWDCASGCIWNARAIASVTLVEERERQREAA